MQKFSVKVRPSLISLKQTLPPTTKVVVLTTMKKYFMTDDIYKN